MTEGNNNLLELHTKIDRLSLAIQTMKEKQEEMFEHLSKIKESVYNPDQGLYARLKELETWKSTSSRLIWILVTSTTALIGALVLKQIG